MSNTGILLYCISNSEKGDWKHIAGLDKEFSIYSIEEQGIYGIVSEVSLEEYGQENIEAKGQDIEWLTEKASKFMDIILTVSSQGVVIPMKFLTIFNSLDRVKEVLRNNIEVFSENLIKLEGKEEHSLKIYCNEKIFKETSMEEEVKTFEESLIGKPKGSAFFLRKKFENELKEIVQDKICKTANSIIEGASHYFEDIKSNKLLAKELTGVQEKMILNTAVLIKKEQKQALYEYIHTIKDQHEKNGFYLQISGPWPPYNFCNTIKQEE